MVQIRVEATIRGLNQFTRKLSPEALFSSARSSMEECLGELQETVVELTPEASGDTKGSIFYEINGTTIDDLNGRVLSSSEHFANLEYGRSPGSKNPPVNVILRWMREKGLEPYDDSIITEKDLAYVIARAIGRRGIPALRIMHRALQIQRPHFSTIFLRRWIEDWNSR